MESNTPNSPEISLHRRQYKDKHFQAQFKRVFRAFQQPKTMLMVSIETGILRANICRFVAELKEQKRIVLVKTGICKISKHRAGYYCTSIAIAKLSKTNSHE